MKLHVLFMQRRDDEEGERAPEWLVCYDDEGREEDPEGFAEDIEQAKREHADDAAGFALVTLVVDGAKIRDMCLDRDRVMGAVIGQV